VTGKSARTGFAAALCSLLVACVWVAGAAAQTSLGGQRVGTASGTFLKIPLSARAAGLANAYAVLASGPEAAFFNPAGVAFQEKPAVTFGCVQWPADISIFAFSHSRRVGRLGLTMAFSLAGFRTTLLETDEFHPLGTGRQFSFSDWVAGLTIARHLTDRLSVGMTVKGFLENLGTEVGGPRIATFLVDVGSVYRVGYREAKMGLSLSNFGPDLRPSGTFPSNVQGTDVSYSGFSAPTMFRVGFAMDVWRRGPQVLWLVTEIQNQADNEETVIGALEWTYGDFLAARAGYNGTADAFKLGFGLGWKVQLQGSELTMDYAFSDGEDLGNSHRWFLTFAF
jgi:hypothetical protein